MGYEHDTAPETDEAIQAAVAAAARESDHPDDAVMVTGYGLVGEYMTGDGEHWWTIRYKPGAGVRDHVGFGAADRGRRGTHRADHDRSRG
jgi:hypothetical protein